MRLTFLRRRVLPLVGLLLMGALAGCSSYNPVPVYPPGVTIPADATNVVFSLGLLPEWDTTEMVEQSDAIAIGTLSEKLDTKADSQGGGNPTKYYYEFTNYKFSVEEALYPANLPDSIAILAETGVVPAIEGYAVIPPEGIPTYKVDEPVLLFLKNLTDEDKYGDGASQPVPDGFTVSDYYLTIVGGKFGKLVDSGESGRDGTVWNDSRGSANSVAVDRLKRVIAEIKG